MCPQKKKKKKKKKRKENKFLWCLSGLGYACTEHSITDAVDQR
jgi:hypothetical protein